MSCAATTWVAPLTLGQAALLADRTEEYFEFRAGYFPNANRRAIVEAAANRAGMTPEQLDSWLANRARRYRRREQAQEEGGWSWA